MSNKKLKSNLRFTYVELEDYALNLISNVQRDIVYFSRYGIGEVELDVLKDKLQAFKSMPSDEEMQTGRTLISKRKNSIIRELIKVLRDIQLRVQSVIGKNSPQFLEFKLHNLSALKDQNLLNEAYRIVDFIKQNPGILRKRAYTQDDFVHFKSVIRKLEKALSDYRKATERRRRNALKRKAAAQEVYGEVVDLSDIGKTIWKMEDNSVKYSHYVLYPVRRKGQDQNKKIENNIKSA